MSVVLYFNLVLGISRCRLKREERRGENRGGYNFSRVLTALVERAYDKTAGGGVLVHALLYS